VQFLQSEISVSGGPESTKVLLFGKNHLPGTANKEIEYSPGLPHLKHFSIEILRLKEIKQFYAKKGSVHGG
jgi:hypothetical protein